MMEHTTEMLRLLSGAFFCIIVHACTYCETVASKVTFPGRARWFNFLSLTCFASQPYDCVLRDVSVLDACKSLMGMAPWCGLLAL